MKYQYKFGTGYESIEVDEEWIAVLQEMDRLERSNNFSETKKSIHYDAFGFEPDFMCVEEKGYADPDEDIAAIFDGSPAFEYAVDHLLPRHREVLYRRAIQEESFASIARALNSETSVVWSYYQRLCARFRRHYEEWRWMHSDENIAPEGAGRVTQITKSLNPAQIMAIRAYRYQYKTINDIARLMGISRTRVERCLQDNPILETKCPACGKLVKQPERGAMRVFCAHKCYLKWYRDNACNFEIYGPTTRTKAHLTDCQKKLINFYRQRYIPVPQIGKIVGIPRMHVEAFVREFPLPYTICQFCGAKITSHKSRKLLKYCNDKCRERHDNSVRGTRKNRDLVHQQLLPSPEQLRYALLLRDSRVTKFGIRIMAGLSKQDSKDLFRFGDVSANVKEKNKMTPSKQTTKFVTDIVTFVNGRIWEPQYFEGFDVPVYTATILIPKDQTKTIEAMDMAQKSALITGMLNNDKSFLKKAKSNLPVHDGDAPEMDEHFRGCWVINASSLTAPAVWDHSIMPITDRELVHPGCKIRVSLTFFTYTQDDKKNAGVGCMLGNIQKVPFQKECDLLSDIDFDKFTEEFTRVFLK